MYNTFYDIRINIGVLYFEWSFPLTEEEVKILLMKMKFGK